MISEATTDAIFSLESEAGSSPCSSPGGKGQSGLALVPVSRSASPAKAQGKRTPDTCGPLFTSSSPSADLQQCLANRLAARLAVDGSPEYALTWKAWDMESGPPICALRASGRRISGSGSGGWRTPSSTDGVRGSRKAPTHARTRLNLADQTAGWPTPRTADGDKNVRTPTGCMAEYARRPTGHDLNTAAVIAGWATPRVTTNGGNGNPERAADGKARLEDQVQGWATPSARDWRSEAGPGHDARMAETRGQPLSRQTATTGGRGALAPEFSRWLMGFPAGWENYADSATPSCRRSPPSS